MKIKKILHNLAWIFVVVFAFASFSGGIILVLKASEPVEPPEITKMPLKSKNVKHKYLTSKEVLNKKSSRKKSGKIKPSIKSKNKLKLPISPMLSAGNVLEKPSSLRKAVTGARSRIQIDPNKVNNERIKSRRIENQKRRYDYMNKRIERLEKRLNKLKQSDNPDDNQVDRLEKSINRLKKRKEDLEKRLKDAGAI